MKENLPYEICNRENNSRNRDVDIYKLKGGDYIVTVWGDFRNILQVGDIVLIEIELGELLQKYAPNRIKLTNIVITRRTTNEEWRNYCELELIDSTDSKGIQNTESSNLEIDLIDNRIFISANLKKLIEKDLKNISDIEIIKGSSKYHDVILSSADSSGPMPDFGSSDPKPETASSGPKSGGSSGPKSGTGSSGPKAGGSAGIPDIKSEKEENFQDYESSNNAKIIKLYFGTDRNVIQKNQDDDITFGSDNSDLTYGICNVTIPSQHKIGEIERPWMNLKILEKESKHITFKDLIIEEKESFISKFNKDLNASPSKSALVFIHGFNVNFVNAAMRTAQISYDLKFEGIRSFYSWPSKGETASYSRDEEAIQLSESKLKEYFNEVFLNSAAENIYLIGHSMGTRLLSRVVADLIQENPIFKKKLKEIILTAPDINAKIFKDELVPKFRAQQKTITLYASTEDIALKASRKIHGFSRAGESGNNIVITNGVETIDASGMDTGFLKHSYFGESRTVINDIHNLISFGKRPDKRMDLLKEKSKEGDYWKFRK